MIRTKKQELEDRAKEELRLELNGLNGKGQAFAPDAALPTSLCTTRYPIALARKLAKKFPSAEFTIVVKDGYEDQEYEVRYRPVWAEVRPQGDAPDTEYRLRDAVERARKSLKQLQETPSVAQLQLYAQGVADALVDAEKIRKELEEVKQRGNEHLFPRMMPMFMYR